MQLSKNSARALTCPLPLSLPVMIVLLCEWQDSARPSLCPLPLSLPVMIVLLCDWQDSARSSVCPLPVSLPNECTPRAQSSHLTAARRAPAGYVTSVSYCHSISVPAVILFPVPAVILLSLRLAQLSFESQCSRIVLLLLCWTYKFCHFFRWIHCRHSFLFVLDDCLHATNMCNFAPLLIITSNCAWHYY